jgi:uncharacterized protein YPO0396
VSLVITAKHYPGIERDNLEAHVELCQQRHQTLEKRIDEAEESLAQLKDFRDHNRREMIKAVTTAATLSTALISVLIIILDRM